MGCESYLNNDFGEIKLTNKLRINEPISFSETIVEEVFKLLTFDKSASAGNGSIPTKVLKYCAHFFAHWLTKLFNHCIKQEMVTKDWKNAIISPLFKGKGAREELDIYRGISILQVIVKLFERVLLDLTELMINRYVKFYIKLLLPIFYNTFSCKFFFWISNESVK